MAGPHEQLGVGAHERHGHRQLRPIRDRQIRPRAQLLDAAEQVVPAAGVQPGGVLAQLVQDLVHLERGEDRLDQDRRPDRAARDPERDLAVDEDLVPEPRLVVTTRAWPGRSTARCPAAASRRRCGTGTARSRTGWPRPGSPSTSIPDSTRCQPRGRTTSVAVSVVEPIGLALGRFEGRACRRTASASAAWPPTTLAQVGESASSRSAMKTRAPELSALIIILGSAGPVISTRRSSRSAGAGATVQSASRTSRVATPKSGRAPAVELGLALLRGARSRSRRSGPNRRWRSATNASASWVRTRSAPGTAVAAQLDAGWHDCGHRQPSPRRTVASISPCGSVVGV